MSADIHKLRPDRSMYLRGFDRRGAAAALHSTSFNPSTLVGGFTVSGLWSDIADFAVLVLHDADDNYGHLTTTRYLPDFDLTGVVLDADIALTNVYSPVSVKYDSLNAAKLSYVANGAQVVTPLAPLITAASGGGYASCLITINGTPIAADVFDVGFFGNFVGSATGQTTAINVAATLEYQINTNAYSLWGQALVPFVIANIVAGNFTDQLTVYAGRSAFANTIGATQPPTQFTFSGAVMTITQAALVGSISGVGYDYRQLVGFWGVRVGDPVLVLTSGGVGYERHTVASVASPWQMTLDSAPAHTPIMVLWPMYGQDGNTIQFWLNTNSAGATFTAGGNTGTNLYPKLAGGSELSSVHLRVPFSTVLGGVVNNVRQAWVIFAPSLTLDTANDQQTLQAFATVEWSAVFSNWTLADPNSKLPLQIGGPGSVVVGSRDGWVFYAGAGWAQHASSDANQYPYYRGFAWSSANAGDSVSIKYSCQATHDLFLSTVLGAGYGTFHVKLDGVSQADLNCAADPTISGVGRRQIASGVAAGSHTVLLTLASSSACYFDFLQAAVPSDTQAPAVTYANANAACDFDTDQTYKIAPARLLWILGKLGFTGDLDFYAGVFFALKRVRAGGSFLSATVTIAGAIVAGDGVFVQMGGGSYLDGLGTVIGVAVVAQDTISTLAQRFCNAINETFIGIWAAPTVTAGQFKLTVMTPINGFTFFVSSGTNATISFTGAIGALAGTVEVGGQEGIWGVDASQASPLNRAFADYLADLAALVHAAGQTMTVAFSQELLGPPDVNSSAGAWFQRYLSGDPVLTSSAFGSWGAGYVESVAAGVYQQTGHGYITGSSAHFASGSGSGIWLLVVTDADHYTLGAQLANSGGYAPAVGDSVFIDLQTTQCAFNPSTVTPYLQKCYVQAANILAAAGLVPWLQFGEVGHWFFSEYAFTPIVGMTSSGGLIEFQTSKVHVLATGQPAIVAGAPAGNGTLAVTVIDATHFTNGTAYAGPYAAAGTVSGGGMAYYDANQTAAATAALGRALASFYTQDDDPSGHSADTGFLAGRIYTHISTMAAAVLAAQAGAKFEWLFPLDVNFPSCYYTTEFPWPQGGRLNNAVNLPSQFRAKSGSGLDRLKMEALSWQSQYFNQDNAISSFRYPYAALSWAKSDIAILIAWDNAACCWTAAWLFFGNEGIPLLNFWALDHSVLFGWPAPLPANRPMVRMG